MDREASAFLLRLPDESLCSAFFFFQFPDSVFYGTGIRIVVLFPLLEPFDFVEIDFLID